MSGDWPPDVSEFEVAGLTPAASERVRAPRVGESPIQFECRLEREVRGLRVRASFLPYCPREELPMSLTAADASLVTLQAPLV